MDGRSTFELGPDGGLTAVPPGQGVLGQGDESVLGYLKVALAVPRAPDRAALAEARRMAAAIARAGCVLVVKALQGASEAAAVAALDAGGRVVAVKAVSLDSPHREFSKRTEERIVEQGGCLLSATNGAAGNAAGYRARGELFADLSDAVAVSSAVRMSSSSAGVAYRVHEGGKPVFAAVGSGIKGGLASELVELGLAVAVDMDKAGPGGPGGVEGWLAGLEGRRLEATVPRPPDLQADGPAGIENMSRDAARALAQMAPEPATRPVRRQQQPKP